MAVHKQRTLNRRQFLGEAPCKALGAGAFFSTLLNLRMASTAAAQSLEPGTDYKALVCLFMYGGNDSFNMLFPRESEAYAVYQNTRDAIALDIDSSLAITTDGQGVVDFSLHPSFSNIRDIYAEGKLGFVANTGTLIRPTTLTDYKAKSYLPKGLFSHSDQQMHWQTVMPQVRGASPGGWGGRTADLIHSMNLDQTVSMSISFAGTNVFQTGKATFPYAASTRGAPSLELMEDPIAKVAIVEMLRQDYSHLFQQTYVDKTQDAIDAADLFGRVVDPIELSTEFPNSKLGRQLRMVAKSLAGHEALGARRHTFFVSKGGFDNHSEVLENQAGLLSDIDASVGAFWTALKELGMEDQVILFSASDFGRTLTTNGAGTDHGWGGNHFVMGGPVSGGRIYGDYPLLHLKSELDAGRGRLIPTTSVDEYYAEMAAWFGVTPGEMDTVFPNVKYFFDPSVTSWPVGFLA